MQSLLKTIPKTLSVFFPTISELKKLPNLIKAPPMATGMRILSRIHNTDFFRIVTPTMQIIRKTCAWVKREKTQWRCYNYENVLENCPETCGMCSASLPTNKGPASTSKRWCQNSWRNRYFKKC